MLFKLFLNILLHGVYVCCFFFVLMYFYVHTLDTSLTVTLYYTIIAQKHVLIHPIPCTALLA